MVKYKTLTLHEDTWKMLTQMKLDRNFHSLGDLILSFIKEESIKPKCASCNEEPVEHEGDFCLNCDLPERSRIQ